MANTKMFRNSLSGYNKEDVNKYIKDTDARHADEIETLKSEAEKLASSVDTLNAECATLRENIASTESKVCALSDEKKALEEKSAELTAKIAEISAELDEAKKKTDFYKAESEAQINVISQLRADKEALVAEIEGLRTVSEPVALNDTHEAADDASEDRESDEYKLLMYNKVSAQLGDIIINANRTADEIVSKAKAEAEEIRQKAEAEAAKLKADTEEEAAYIRKRLSTVAEDLLARVSSDLHGSIDSSVREINTYASDIQYEIKALITKISSRSNEMYDRIGYYQTCVSEGIDKRLCDMDKKYGIKPFGSEDK